MVRSEAMPVGRFVGAQAIFNSGSMMPALYALFWITGGTALAARLVAASRRPIELLSPINVVLLGFFWLYLIGYLTLDPTLAVLFLSDSGYARLLAVSTLSATCFWIGLRAASPGRLERRVPCPSFVRRAGCVLIFLGGGAWAYFLWLSGGFWEYYGSPHGAAGAWLNTTAYVYGGSLFLYAGAFLLLTLVGSSLRFFSTALLGGALLFLIFDAWVSGSRGDWLRLGSLFGLYFAFVNPKRRPRRFLILGLLTLMATLVAVTPFIRGATYLGADQSITDSVHQALGLFAQAEATAGREIVLASGLVEAASQQGVLGYGLPWLHPIINVIPRLWWPAKPYAAEFGMSNDLILWQAFGWVSWRGSVPTGVADAFVQFSWASPLVWLLLGILGGRMFKRVLQAPHVIAVGYFYAYLVGLIYMVLQGFIQAVYAAAFIAVPLHACFTLARLSARSRVRVQRRGA